MKKVLVSCCAVLGLVGCDVPANVTRAVVTSTVPPAIQNIETSYSYKDSECLGIKYYHDDEGTVHLLINESKAIIYITGNEYITHLNGIEFEVEDDGDVEFTFAGCEGDIEHPEDAVDDALEDLTEIFGTSAILVGAGALHKKHKKAKTKIKTVVTKREQKKAVKVKAKAAKKATSRR